MSELESITTDVNSSSLEQQIKITPVDFADLLNRLLDELPRDKSDTVRQGSVIQGFKKLTFNSIIRDSLFQEIDNITLDEKNRDVVEKAEKKLKKLLKIQVNNILSVLEDSTNDINVYFILGILLKGMQNEKGTIV